MAWLLYFISLIPLFIYVGIKYFTQKVFILFYNGNFSEITYGQYAFIISVLLFLTSIFILIILKHRSGSGYEIHGAKITTEPFNINHELIGVLSSVVLPFLTVNFNTGNEICASIFMLLVIGLITTRSTIYYKNPVLAILNLKIYQINIEHSSLQAPTSINVISFYTLSKGDSLYLKAIGDKVYYSKKANHEQKTTS